MSAKSSDLAKVQEIWDVATQARRQITALGITKQRFLDPADDSDDSIAEGLMNRVLRITEEAGKISDAVAERFGFDCAAASGVRNRLAHAYVEVDREIIWEVVERDLGPLLEACRAYCDENGVELG
ncbi:DUF86 domain-containing protein [Paratractidigestivibacter sp.]|uniref:HepT-like ribonuclease domain-containing protein n=1 Tax=Paratractidigestivibacter sp. TaxID=2847316 RepID=UPI002AC98B64|nr:HepT-like ribonuclease domain-containing protein [Paratractidigestivibacter sp.]